MGKKLQKNFRLAAALANELAQRADRSGLNETRIVEDALALYLGSDDPGLLERQAFVLREDPVPYKVSSKPATAGTRAEQARLAGSRKPKDAQ